MTTSKQISPVEQQTLNQIRTFITANGYSPTIAELARLAGVNGNAVSERVERLLAKGAITKKPRIARSIRLA
jgi:Mn-dependent DtxR family transcriptional regulator